MRKGQWRKANTKNELHVPINNNSKRSRLITVLNDQNYRLVEHTTQLFVGNQNRSGFHMRNRMSPPVLVNGDLGIEQKGQLVGTHKWIFVFRYRVRQNASNGVAIKNVLGRRSGGRGSSVFGLKDTANRGAKEIPQLALFAQFFAAGNFAVVVVVITTIGCAVTGAAAS